MKIALRFANARLHDLARDAMMKQPVDNVVIGSGHGLLTMTGERLELHPYIAIATHCLVPRLIDEIGWSPADLLVVPHQIKHGRWNMTHLSIEETRGIIRSLVMRESTLDSLHEKNSIPWCLMPWEYMRNEINFLSAHWGNGVTILSPAQERELSELLIRLEGLLTDGVCDGAQLRKIATGSQIWDLVEKYMSLSLIRRQASISSKALVSAVTKIERHF